MSVPNSTSCTKQANRLLGQNFMTALKNLYYPYFGNVQRWKPITTSFSLHLDYYMPITIFLPITQHLFSFQ